MHFVKDRTLGTLVHGKAMNPSLASCEVQVTLAPSNTLGLKLAQASEQPGGPIQIPKPDLEFLIPIPCSWGRT